ncbi:MAG: four helix bundle protein [Sandaracinaceae bacterium]
MRGSARDLDTPARGAGGQGRARHVAEASQGGFHVHFRPHHRCFTLRVYSVAVDAVRRLRPMLEAVARKDADLARQFRQATHSFHLNIAEGMNAYGRIKHARYDTALGSANEVLACLDCAEALGYIDADPIARDRVHHVRATLIKLKRSRR